MSPTRCLRAQVEQLEAALRNETIANEEQRSYISILKNIIESKMERHGVVDILHEMARNQNDYQTFGGSQPDTAQTFLSLVDLKSKIDEQAAQIKQILRDSHQYQATIQEQQQCI